MTIKELRTQEGLSQSEMAKKLGIATSAIGHMENGRMKVSPKIAAKAKEEFGVDLDIEPKARSEEHTSETPVTIRHLVCRLLLGAHV